MNHQDRTLEPWFSHFQVVYCTEFCKQPRNKSWWAVRPYPGSFPALAAWTGGWDGKYSIQYGLIGYWTVRVLCTVRYFCRYFSQAAVSYFILYTHLTSVLYNLECTYYTRLSVIVHSIECDCTWVYTEKTTLECTLTWVYFAKNYTQLSVHSAFLLKKYWRGKHSTIILNPVAEWPRRRVEQKSGV